MVFRAGLLLSRPAKPLSLFPLYSSFFIGPLSLQTRDCRAFRTEPKSTNRRIGVVASHLNSDSPMASEKEAAAAATPPPTADSPTIFDKIIKKEIPANIVYEDDKVLAFRDISPQAPVHILIIPKVKDGLTGISKAEERHIDILGRLMYSAKLVAKQEGLEDGYRVVINDGPSGCQSVYHIHVHLLGGRQMNWPPG